MMGTIKLPPTAQDPASPKQNKPQGATMTETKDAGETRMQIMLDPDMDYVYRDMFNVHVGLDEVILEFGNLHRVPENSATISDRIVLSVRNAVRLQQVLGRVIKDAQEKTLAAAKK